MASGIWSTRTARRLAERHEVTERQIWRDREHVLEETQRAIEYDDRRKAKTDLLMKCRTLYQQAVRHGKLITATKLLSFEANVMGAFEPVQVQVTHQVDEMSEVEWARQILDPDTVQWAKEQLVAAGEELPETIDLPLLEVVHESED